MIIQHRNIHDMCINHLFPRRYFSISFIISGMDVSAKENTIYVTNEENGRRKDGRLTFLRH